MKEEIREGEVSSSSWFSDAKENEFVYEQSVYNPEVGRVLTVFAHLYDTLNWKLD